MGHGAGPSLCPPAPALNLQLCPSRPWHPRTYLADVQELVQGHALVQVQRLPQGSVSLALPAGGGHGAENGAGKGHPLPGAHPHPPGQVAPRPFPGIGACPQPGQVGQDPPVDLREVCCATLLAQQLREVEARDQAGGVQELRAREEMKKLDMVQGGTPGKSIPNWPALPPLTSSPRKGGSGSRQGCLPAGSSPRRAAGCARTHRRACRCSPPAQRGSAPAASAARRR